MDNVDRGTLLLQMSQTTVSVVRTASEVSPSTTDGKRSELRPDYIQSAALLRYGRDRLNEAVLKTKSMYITSTYM